VKEGTIVMLPYEKMNNVKEQHLEDLFMRYSGALEEGLVCVDHQVITADRGRLDVLLVDSARTFVVAELKVVEDDGMLLQALRYYDYVASNVESFARLYPTPQPDPTKQVRLLLIAPSFSQTLLGLCRWIDADISLFTYSCLRMRDSDSVVPVFNEVSVPPGPAIVVGRERENHLTYITDEAVRQLASDLLDEVRTWQNGLVSVEAIKHMYSLKCDGSVIAYLETRRKGFVVTTYQPDGLSAAYRVTDAATCARARDAIQDVAEKRRQGR